VSVPSTPGRPDGSAPIAVHVPPRADVPARPDVPSRLDRPSRRRPRWTAPVAVVSVLALFAIVGLSFSGDGFGPGRRSGSALSASGDGYGFLDTRPYSGRTVPVRWNPCEPIRYEVNLVGAPADALDQIQRATSRVTEATGIPFAYDGTTHRTLGQTGHDSFYPNGVEGTYYPVLFIWIPHERMVRLTDEQDVLAFTHPELGEAERSDQWVSGWIVVDIGGHFESDGRYSLELVLMHELGHLVGLDHVPDQDELMFSDEVAPDASPEQMYDWGPGDEAGLELVGSDQGCMDHVDVAP
jgi:hypothetical protein